MHVQNGIGDVIKKKERQSPLAVAELKHVSIKSVLIR